MNDTTGADVRLLNDKRHTFAAGNSSLGTGRFEAGCLKCVKVRPADRLVRTNSTSSAGDALR